jgi:hypothetical protein
MSKSEKYIEHSSIECHGIDIADTSGGTTPGERIWVGSGENGRWLTSREVRELAVALLSMADRHDVRLVDAVTMPDYLAAMDRPNS